ncbi:MAG TPA: UDP-N-acetylmuramate:L-alanyl-gamma-D-glutamyl-meso-diaminopimelate ligase, partial [Myxococcota bacterium]|nr:UDP-N-acetylmuramate:L-alanyl-gamma-D-glutamyl-meso-diaminopimelate ligase [Myxococcota bacterium]
GEVTECLSAEAMTRALRERGREAADFERVEDMVDWVVGGRRPGDVVLVMSNGAFGGIWEKLLRALAVDD